MDHGVRDPECDHCKRASGPLYHHKIVGNRHLPVFTFDFSGPHPHTVNMAQYLLVSVWSLGHMRIIWAFGVESRQSDVVLPCLQSCFEDLRALTGGSRPPILRLHSDKASEFLTPTIRAYLSQQGVRQTLNSGYDPQGPGVFMCTLRTQLRQPMSTVREKSSGAFMRLRSLRLNSVSKRMLWRYKTFVSLVWV